jgi:deazaflavin-dependent oxidoreductase (nitroreductase family)
MVRLLSKLHAGVYQATRGVVGRRLVNNDILLLTTRGRHSGQPHTVPLVYLEGEGDDHVLVASFGGRPHHPDWYENLCADPNVEIQVRGRRFAARARTATPAEQEKWWPRAVSAFAGYADYQAKTTRKIPIVFLHH